MLLSTYQYYIIFRLGVYRDCIFTLNTLTVYRPDRTSWLQCWSNGELGPDHLQRNCPPIQSRRVIHYRQGVGGKNHLAWARSYGMRTFSGVLPVISLILTVSSFEMGLKNLALKWSSVLSVVWKLGDHEVVEWPVAQWGLCHIRLLSWSQLCWTTVENGELCSLVETHPGWDLLDILNILNGSIFKLPQCKPYITKLLSQVDRKLCPLMP